MSRARKFTYFSQQKTVCQVCRASFFREDILTGRGRLIAGELTEELYRNYVPSSKFGEIYPLCYPIPVCPECFTALMSEDFVTIPDGVATELFERRNERIEEITRVFGDIDFRNYRTLKEGTASHLLALICYEHMPSRFSPTFKQGVSALRGAWLSSNLHERFPGDNWDYLSSLLYRKASFLYTEAVRKEENGEEDLLGIGSMGPDLDKNYGYDGVVYLSGLLEYKFGPREDIESRHRKLERAKVLVARLFGMGETSKNKPEALLDRAKALHKSISDELSGG